ncbi:hypothetical protein [Turicimonas sp. TL08]
MNSRPRLLTLFIPILHLWVVEPKAVKKATLEYAKWDDYIMV